MCSEHLLLGCFECKQTLIIALVEQHNEFVLDAAKYECTKDCLVCASVHILHNSNIWKIKKVE